MSILVSINCVTYNHQKYIAQAIEGFLMQKTDFDYEILIHDDASTDGTAAIIRKYARQYPDIIKPIYQTENQYSKGLKIGTTFNIPRAQGKYIAVCEGDDYWTDPLKLQKQVDYMEAHPECSMCFHAIELVYSDATPMGRGFAPYDSNHLVPIEDLIAGGGGFFGTNSLVYLKKCMDNPPDFYLKSPVGDVPLVLNLAIQGEVYYFAENMSAYRQGVGGSWSNRVAASSDYTIKYSTNMIKMRRAFNEYTEYKYASSIELCQIRSESLILMAQGNVQALKAARYKEYYGQMGRIGVAKIYFKKYFPRLFNTLRIGYNNILANMARIRSTATPEKGE